MAKYRTPSGRILDSSKMSIDPEVLKGTVLIEETPTSAAKETPARVLPPVVPPAPTLPSETQPVDSLGNLRIALRAALSEAAQSTVTSRMTQLSGLMGGGAAPSVINAAIGLAQQGLQTSSAQIFSDAMTGYTEQQKLQEAKKTSALNMINMIIDNGVFADTPAGALLAWEKEAGLPEGTALAWQARLKIAQDQSDEAEALQIKKLKQDIADAGTSRPSPFIDVMQQNIDLGMTPEESARGAAIESENQGISVDQETLTDWIEQAKKLIPKPAPLVVPEPEKKGFLDFLKKPAVEKQSSQKQSEKSVTAPSITEEAATATNSFFSSLFGG